MRYITIPNTDLKASVICIGGGPLSVENDDIGVYALLDAFIELGGNFIDSANVYGKWLPSGMNTCDINIGNWLKSRGLRDNVIVTSKGGHPHLTSMSVSRLSKNEVAVDLEESLAALQCDVIDLYYLHRDDKNIPVSTIIDYLNDFVKQGKIRYFGVSNWSLERIMAAQEYALKSNQQPISANQVMWSYPVYNIAKSTIPGLVWLDRESIQYHRESQLTVVAYQSQAKGFFSKLTVNAKDISPSLLDEFRNKENNDRYQRALAMANEMGVGINTVSLAYVINQSFPSIAIIGSHTEQQIRTSMGAADISLIPEQMAFLESG